MSMPKGKHRGLSASRRVGGQVGKAAAVTGVAAAVPLVGMATAPAQAASVGTWEKLAQCESGGDWSINTGNGFYGGLQFTASTWSGFGGDKYADRADHASKSEQIAIAEKVLDGQGWGAWPACSAKLGLGDSDKNGDPGTPAPSDDSSDDSGSSDSGSSNSDSGSSSSSQESERESASEKPSRSSRESSQQSFGSGPTVRKAVAGANYAVKAGDSLSKIAQSQDVDGGWKALWKANKSLLGEDPNLIMTGEKLLVR